MHKSVIRLYPQRIGWLWNTSTYVGPDGIESPAGQALVKQLEEERDILGHECPEFFAIDTTLHPPLPARAARHSFDPWRSSLKGSTTCTLPRLERSESRWKTVRYVSWRGLEERISSLSASRVNLSESPRCVRRLKSPFPFLTYYRSESPDRSWFVSWKRS